MEKARKSTLGGSRGGRGYRYQDAATAYLCTEALCDDRSWVVIPEGGDDATLDTSPGVMELQIKSRQPHLGDVPTTDFATWLAELDAKHDQSHALGLILERNVRDLEPTGLDTPLASQSPEALKQRLRERHEYAPDEIEKLLSRTYLVVLPFPIQSAAAMLEDFREVPEKLAEIAVRQIQARVGELAELQSAVDAPPIIGLSATDISSIVDRTLEVVDLEALEAPVRTGLCEPVDFSVRVPEESFYLGVDVIPGHVAEGLVFQRPDDVESVVAKLSSERIAVITGQSGAGKSALAWLSVFSSRTTIKWIRVRPLANSSDVVSLIRFAESLRATPHAPVGFVLDNITGELADVWDVLASEIRFRPELVLLGTIREEDLATLTHAPISSRVRARMNSRLAKQIFEGLRARNKLTVEGWKESFQGSGGLMLEYVHLLTTGTRLPSVIAQQIDQRRDEERDLELAILRTVSVAAIAGGRISIDSLKEKFGASDGDLQRALVRLLNEHLIREIDPGMLGGLHEVRSRAICDASHSVPPPTLGQTARVAVSCVPSSELTSVVGNLIHAGFLAESDAQDELTKRVIDSPGPQMLAIALNALRQLSVTERAAAFIRILKEKHVSAAHQELAVQLAAIGAEALDYLAPEIGAAVQEMATVPAHDPRLELLERLPTEVVQAAVQSADTPSQATDVLEAFEGMGESAPISLLAKLGSHLTGATLPELSRALLAARAASTDLSKLIIEAVGGAEEVLRRARTELPWIQRLELAGQAEGHRVEAEWLFIGSSSQDNPHELVVEQCHILAGLFPDVHVVSVTAIDPRANRPELATS